VLANFNAKCDLTKLISTACPAKYNTLRQTVIILSTVETELRGLSLCPRLLSMRSKSSDLTGNVKLVQTAHMIVILYTNNILEHFMILELCYLIMFLSCMATFMV